LKTNFVSLNLFIDIHCIALWRADNNSFDPILVATDINMQWMEGWFYSYNDGHIQYTTSWSLTHG